MLGGAQGSLKVTRGKLDRCLAPSARYQVAYLRSRLSKILNKELSTLPKGSLHSPVYYLVSSTPHCHPGSWANSVLKLGFTLRSRFGLTWFRHRSHLSLEIPAAPQTRSVGTTAPSLSDRQTSSSSYVPAVPYLASAALFDMADVDMTDAPVAAPIAKKKGAAAGDAESSGGKKRFEVKKVCASRPAAPRVGGLPVANLVLCSGTPLRSGRGTSSSTTAPSAETTSWISVRNQHVSIPYQGNT